MGHSVKDCQEFSMKLLIVFGLLPVFQANPLQYGTRQMTNTLISTLQAMSNDHRVTATFDKIFNNDNTCLNNIDEAIEGLRKSADLMAAAEGDLQTLVEKLSPMMTSNNNCPTSLDSLRGLSVVMHELSYDDTVAINKQARDMFHKAGNIVSVVATFLSQLQSHARNFGTICNPDKTSTMRAISAVGDMVGSLADLFSSLGNYKAGVEVRKGADFASKIANQIPRLNDLNIGFLDCSMKDFNEAAQTMDDIASLVEDIGLERLSNDLGFNFS